ncbi:MAG: hypothetical protein KGD61_11420 [Candidatus Lokiarchaeota archaeon]|nr:hypothetical protein [Candidatus Lokiarchaeota archaeon]
MTKAIQDLWILTSNGIVVFNRVFDAQLKTQLFGALMSALNSFAEQLAEGGLSNFELSEKRFIIMKKKAFLFVANSSKKIKEKKVVEQLEIISETFFEKYNDNLVDWDYDIAVFSGFEKDIGDSLQDPIKEFWKGF